MTNRINYPLEKQRGKRQRLPLSEPQQRLVSLLARQAVDDHLRRQREKAARQQQNNPLPNRPDLG